MTRGGRIGRRRFLTLSGVAAAAVASAGAAKLLLGGPEEKLTTKVAGAFRDRDAARTIGEAYLSDHDDEDDERRLVDLLEASNSAWRGVATSSEVRALGRADSRRDYAAGRLARVDGWLLSVTEARLCALSTFA